ncbi:translocase of chloroplast 120, chloroplastic-like [Actinidia eriantha]|uniref:translocase of chloroplast 120, chloroplastic-like n=1 Tax=Actinidia eriantha TaxID=165200 RepID=UPI002587ABBE|nr:translocase of chloroplast 120, chloroplastic-like [Actinidia eriantha]XP_057496034.1 translocase of chloroplast 120, chloroplastic-like [Actinidia eriantha]
MENGVGVVDGSHLGEKAMENEVLRSRVEEMGGVGSDESKDSEGEEIFEEAIGADTPRVYSIDDNVVVSRDDNVDKVGDLGGSVDVDENSCVGIEVDKFEEAIGVSVAAGNREDELPVGFEDKVEGEVTGKLVDGAAVHEVIDEESVAEKDLRDGLNRMENETNLKNGDETDQKFGGISEKCENGTSDIVNLEERPVNGHANEEAIQFDKESESRVSQIVQGGDSDSQQEVDSIGETLHQSEKSAEVKPTMGLFDTGHQDYKSCKNEDIVASELHTDNVEGAKDNLVNLDRERYDDKIRELKEEAPVSPVLLYHNGRNEELKDMSNVGLENQDERSCELECTSASTDSDHYNISLKPEDAQHMPLEGSKAILEVEKLSRSEDSVGETDEKSQASAKIEGAQLQQADRDTEASNVAAKELENKGAKDEEVKRSTQGIRQGEIKPAATVPTFSGKSAIPTPAPARPAGLGQAAPLLEPAPRVGQQLRMNGTLSQMQNQPIEDSANGESEENDETREKLQMIRVKFLRLAHRLGQTPHNVVVAQVLYRLGLAEQLRGRNGGRVGAFSFDRASAMAEQLEAAGKELLDFSCTIMVLGKTGVGKSATINSIFDEVKFGTDAFELGTKKVQDVVGTVQGIKVRVIDTPGLLPSRSDQRQNEKILHSIKRFIKKTPPDIVLYLDRLDMQGRDFGDMPLLRTITEIFGPSIWFNAIVVLTHAASAPPEGPNGTATSYDMFVTQRSHVVQQAIRQAAGDMRLMNPVSLVENHSACRTNRAGQRVLPNGQVWKPHLLLLSFASKILAEANTLLKLQDSPPGKAFATRTKAPPLPFLLSSLLQSRPQLKLPEEQFGDDDGLDDDLDESSDSDNESEYDKLPPFKRLTNDQLAMLGRAQRKAYFDELELREKLFMKKQLKEEKKRRKMMKKHAAFAKDLPSSYSENVEEESGDAASVPVPIPDLALPASFDSDNPTHRFRHLDSPNQWVVRPVLDTHGWDHDVGYEGVNVETLFVVKQAIPVSFSGQLTKDKKDANLQMEIASSVKHGEGKATSLGFDMQTLGKDMAYTLRSETRFSNYRRNKATMGISATLLGDALSAGLKVEDKLIVNKRLGLVVSGGAMTGRGDVAYGGSLEATLRDKDHPLGRSLSTFGLSVMDWHGDLAIGGNLQSQIPIGRHTNLIARASLNNRCSGQVSIRLNSSEQLQIAFVGLLPLLRKLLGYSQELQFGQ